MAVLVRRPDAKSVHYVDTATGQAWAEFAIHDQSYQDDQGAWQPADEAPEDDNTAQDGVTYRRLWRRLRHLLRVARATFGRFLLGLGPRAFGLSLKSTRPRIRGPFSTGSLASSRDTRGLVGNRTTAAATPGHPRTTEV